MKKNKDILELIKNYLSENEKISFALIFGSYADNKNGAMSDIDIGAFFVDKIKPLELGQIIFDLERISGRKIDFVELNGLSEKDPFFAYNIISKSVLLFARDIDSFIRYKTRVQLAYFDVKPMLEEARKTFLKRIREGKFGEKNYD